MKQYVVLLRGINVGGKNKISMVALKRCLEELGFTNVATYIASGNVILESDKAAVAIKNQIEKALLKSFTLDSDLIKVLVLSQNRLAAIVAHKPKGFGEQPEKYHSDAIFLIDISADEAMPVFNPREGVDTVWPGDGVIYFQRLSALRTKSRLSNVVGTATYKSMTIRTWNTTVQLLSLISSRKGQNASSV